MKRFAALFITVLLSSCMMHAMGMSMRVEMRPRDPEPKVDHRKYKKTIRKIVSEVRNVEGVFREARAGNKDFQGLNNALLLGIFNESDSILKEALLLGAHPNCTIRSSEDRMLDRADRVSAITLLLEHGADPKLCRESPIVRMLSYYFDREGLREKPYEDRESYRERLTQDQLRRVNKVFKCVKVLQEKGANINQTAGGECLIGAITNLVEEYKLQSDAAAYFLRALIWRGTNTNTITSSPYAYSIKYRLRAYAIEERKKYNATIGFLSCAKYEDSPVNALPKETREIVGRLAKQGFEFNYIKEAVPEPENRAEEASEAVQEGIAVAEEPYDSDDSSPQAVAAAVSDTDDGEESDSERSKAQRSRAPQSAEIAIAAQEVRRREAAKNNLVLLSRRNLSQKIAMICCAAVVVKIGHNYWKRWRKLQKKRQEKKLLKKQYKDLIESELLFA